MASGQAKSRKRIGHKRRMAGWLLLVIGVLIAGVWGASRWWTYEWRSMKSTLIMQGGMCSVYVYNELKPIDHSLTIPAYYFFVERDRKWDWLVPDEPSIMEVQGSAIYLFIADTKRVVVPNATTRITKVVLWPFALVSLLGGGWLVWSGRRARRRVKTNACLKCGYDLSGLGAGVACPECGKPPAAR